MRPASHPTATEYDEPTVRVMALHAIEYCERLFYLEEVEEIRVADDRVYAGRTLHKELADGEMERRSFECDSHALGIRGKVDAVRHREGGWVPIEHKRGRSRREPNGSASAWPSDALQVSAYGLLVEEASGTPVSEGRVRYHADNITVRVPIDASARQAVRDAVERARILRSATSRPPVTEHEARCVRCSLAPVCLPEEERLATDPDHKTLRLFPPHPKGRVLHVSTPGTRIGRSHTSLTIKPQDDESVEKVPTADVAAVVLHGHCQISTQALHLCASREIGVHWLTGGGRYVAALAPTAGPVQRRIRQYQALTDSNLRLELTRRVAQAKAESQLRYLLRASRKSREGIVEQAIKDIRARCRAIPHAENEDAIRGHEGTAARAYFAALPVLLKHDDPAFRPDGRSRRPPQDRFNAILSFGYALLYGQVLQAILAVGLEPAFGFFHTPRSTAHPLVLDIMELFRVVLWDLTVVGSINRRQWRIDEDFTVTKEQVWLSPAGRRKAIELFESRLTEQWKHPVTGYSLSYARTIELEVRLLEKEWTDTPGLFARARLR